MKQEYQSKYEELYEKKKSIIERLEKLNDEYTALTEEIKASNLSKDKQDLIDELLQSTYQGENTTNTTSLTSATGPYQEYQQTQTEILEQTKQFTDLTAKKQGQLKQYLSDLQELKRTLEDINTEEEKRSKSKKVSDKHIEKNVKLQKMKEYGAFFAQVILFGLGGYLLIGQVNPMIGVFFMVLSTVMMSTGSSFSFKFKDLVITGQGDQSTQKK